jgi:hypothetical protein
MDAAAIGAVGKAFFGEGGPVGHVAAEAATNEVMPFSSKIGALMAARDGLVEGAAHLPGSADDPVARFGVAQLADRPTFVHTKVLNLDGRAFRANLELPISLGAPERQMLARMVERLGALPPKAEPHGHYLG